MIKRMFIVSTRFHNGCLHRGLRYVTVIATVSCKWCKQSLSNFYMCTIYYQSEKFKSTDSAYQTLVVRTCAPNSYLHQQTKRSATASEVKDLSHFFFQENNIISLRPPNIRTLVFMLDKRGNAIHITISISWTKCNGYIAHGPARTAPEPTYSW